jgi:hypothetical protein
MYLSLYIFSNPFSRTPSLAALERAENLYRRALCVRPQWKEILQRLGDVHVAQSELSRVHQTAV